MEEIRRSDPFAEVKDENYIFRTDFTILCQDGFLEAQRIDDPDIRLPITRLQALALSLYSGSRTDRSVEETWRGIFSSAQSSAYQVASGRWNLLLRVRENKEFLGQSYRLDGEEIRKAIRSSRAVQNRRSSVPESLIWRYTDRCSRDCLYCYEKAFLTSSREKRSRLSITAQEKLVRALFYRGIRNVHLTGGDPFSEPEVYELIQNLTKHHIHVSILTKEKIDVEKIEGCQWKELRIGFSLDSSREEVVEQLTGSPFCYQDLVSNMKAFSNKGIPFYISYTLTMRNLPTLQEDLDWLMDKGADFVEVVRYQTTGRKEVDRELSLSEEVWQQMCTQGSGRSYVRFESGNCGKYCLSGIKSLTIDKDGTGLLCEIDPDRKRFSSTTAEKEEDPLSLWNQKEYVQYVKKRGKQCILSEITF